VSNIDFSQKVSAAETLASKLSVKREGATLSKSDFCIHLADLGIIPDADCVSAAKGDWPSDFTGFLDFLPAAEARNAQALWASVIVIHRTSSMVIQLAWWFDITDETLDEIFGL
jgi:hypothetical protein